ncbi:hypothetical protein QFC21_005808 [Naganishia friedmannii]|uniref:Uncharacterized protein n=1 Tax=Naganishia friedmannii TaxID=89922 RepID=A0ACC2V7A4_9TREE|nr:hypothetical protein QFC21_005808 [Naganishia friedmannii]
MSERRINPSEHQGQEDSLPIDPLLRPTSTPYDTDTPSTSSHTNTAVAPASELPLVELARDVPDLSEFVRELEGNVALAKELWEPTKKKKDGGAGGREEQMQWSDQATKIMLACVLKVEQNIGSPQGELIEVGQKGNMKRVPIKVSDNGLLKTTGTFVAWGLRKEGFAAADTAAVVNKWWRLKETYNAIQKLSVNRSGAPFPYSQERGFGELGLMQPEFDALCYGTSQKGSKFNHLQTAAQKVKAYRNGPWMWYPYFEEIFQLRGGSSYATGDFCADYMNLHGNDENLQSKRAEPVSADDDDESDTSHSQRPSKRAKSSTSSAITRPSKQSTTLDALKNVGEGNVAFGKALEAVTAQEKERLRANADMLAQYTESNKVKKSRQSQQVRIDAAEAIAGLPAFEALEESEQDAVQEWLDNDDNSADVLKIMAPLRARWLKKKLVMMLEEYETKRLVSYVPSPLTLLTTCSSSVVSFVLQGHVLVQSLIQAIRPHSLRHCFLVPVHPDRSLWTRLSSNVWPWILPLRQSSLGCLVFLLMNCT